MTCPICEASGYEPVWEAGSGVVNGVCLGCGHVYLTGRVHEDADAAYADFSQSYADSSLLDPNAPVFTLARTRVQTLLQWQPDLRSVLEVGSGYGHFLHMLGPKVECFGLDPSRAGIRFAREHFGLKGILPHSLERAPTGWPGQKVDAVCSFHALEHVADPLDFIRNLRSRLVESGLVMLAVPDLRTLNPDLIELYFLHKGWHLHTFSEGSLRHLLGNAGLEVLSVSEEVSNPMLRSSMLVVARGGPAGPQAPLAERVPVSRALVRRFHERLDRGLAAVEAAIGRWAEQGRRIAIYGGGLHTRALLALSSIDVARSLAWVIDDDPAKAGTCLDGVAIRSSAGLPDDPPDVILVSTLAAEATLLGRLSAQLPPTTELYGIYRDFFA